MTMDIHYIHALSYAPFIRNLYIITAYPRNSLGNPNKSLFFLEKSYNKILYYLSEHFF